MPESRTTDAIIVGGGPAGLYAGLKLARDGFGVSLFEEHDGTGEPAHCTGVLARETFDEFGLSSASILNELTTVRFHAPSGDVVEYSPPSVEAVVIDRVEFDRSLARAAVEAGVRIYPGRRVSGVAVDRDGVTVTAGGCLERGRVCVLACGASYGVQQKLGLGLPRLFLHTAQVELAASQAGDVEVHLGEAVAPRGFAWAVPVRRCGQMYARVGVMCDRAGTEHFSRFLGRLAPRWGLHTADVPPPRQKILPLGPLDRTYGDRLLALGDAAGLVKPTTGGGIYYSLLSASFAAATLSETLPRDRLQAAALSAYERRWRKRLGSELRWQSTLRRIARRLTDEDIDGLFSLARTDGIMPLLRRTAAFNHHREFIAALLKHPPARRVLLRAIA